jgi:hypothetical protein
MIADFCNPIYTLSQMKDLFFLCISLSPTQEAKLMEVQRSCFSLYRHPSSYALPPILPVACFRSLEEARGEWKTNTLLKDWKPFVLSTLFRVGNILAAGPTPLPRSSFPKDSLESHSSGLRAFPYLGGFYISEIDPGAPLTPFEDFPRIPVRVVRFQVLRIASMDPEGKWWKGIEWTLEEEKWMKLA